MNSKQAFEYCRDNKKCVPEYEPIIARSAKYSYLYARFVVQGRFELGEKKIFKDLNLEISKGEKIGLIGPTGIGKSTLINILLGILSPQNGKIYINDNYM